MRNVRYLVLFMMIFVFSMGLPSILMAMDGLSLAQKVYERDTGADSRATVRMLLIDKRGSKRFRTMITADKKYGNISKSYIRFLAPADIKGTAFLTWENIDRDDDQFLYLPALKRVRRIVATQKTSRFVNTDYTYEDMQRRKPEQDRHQIIGEEQILKRDCWILESIPKNPEDSQYEKRKSWIAQDIFLPLKGQYFGRKDRLVKEFIAYKIKEVDNIWAVVESEMRDFRKKHRTLMKTEDIKFNCGVADRVFTESHLLHGG